MGQNYYTNKDRKNRMVETRRENMLNKPRLVYILVDPRDSKIKYVGHTNNPRARMADHLYYATGLSTSNRVKSVWLRELLACGLKPLFVTLEVASPETAHEREVFWIETLAKCGAPLVNWKHMPGRRHGHTHAIAPASTHRGAA